METPQPWYAKGGNVAGLLIVLVLLYFAFPYLKGIMPNEKRDKAVKLYNNYITFIREYQSLQRELEKKKPAEPNEARAEAIDAARRGQAIMERLDPYEPIGVDPALAAAVNEYKGAILDLLHEFLDEAVSRRDRQKEKRLIDAQTSIEKEFNRIASEVGGMTRQRGRKGGT